LPHTTAEGMLNVPDLVSDLHAGMAVVPAWDAGLTLKNAHDQYAPLRHMIEQLVARRVDLIMLLDRAPDELTRTLNLEPSQVLEIVQREPRAWRPYLDDLLVNFGLEISRCRIGAAGSL